MSEKMPARTNFNDLKVDGFALEHRGAGWYVLRNSEQGYASWQWVSKFGSKPSLPSDRRMLQISN